MLGSEAIKTETAVYVLLHQQGTQKELQELKYKS